MNFDMKTHFQLFYAALTQSNEKNPIGKQGDEQAMKYLKDRLLETIAFINDHVTKNSVYIHPTKQNILKRVNEKFLHLSQSANYYQMHGNPDKTLLKKGLVEAEEQLWQYFYLGPVYLFRHCNKTPITHHFKTMEKDGAQVPLVYDGISKQDMVDQAMFIADAIANDIRLCPGKARIFMRHSEQPRTRAFANIIINRVIQINHVAEGKVSVDGPKEDSRIRFGHFSNEALAELMPVYKTIGQYHTYDRWFKHIEEFKEFKLQPDPHKVVSEVIGFLKEYEKKVNTADKFFKVAIGISHGWVVDSVIQTLIPAWHEYSQKVMDEATFVKVEDSQLNYLGKWVDFK